MTPEEKYLYVLDLISNPSPAINSAVFNTMRILKGINPGDTYLEAYKWHLHKCGETQFMDYYHILWSIGAVIKPKNILEIGSRTGISICQLLSSMIDYTDIKVYLFDLFDDGFISPELIQMNLRHLNIAPENIDLHFIVGDSLKTIPEHKERGIKVDYALVDGCHDPIVAIQDLNNVVDMVEQGGIIIFDDITPAGCNLLSTWETFKETMGDRFFFVECMSGKGFGIGVKK